jgi:RND family efflux transporter MFP subunit
MKSLFSIFLLAASAAFFTGCHGDESAASAAIQTAPAQVVESRQLQAPVTVSATGTVRARETATISAQVPGRIQQVLVRAGDSVRTGELLVELEDAGLRASVEQAQGAARAAESQVAAAEAQSNLAASTLARYRQLEAEKSVSPQEMDEVARRAEAMKANLEAARAGSRAAEAQESGARTMLSYARITAPFAGVVTARLSDPGTLAAPGVPLLQVDQAGDLQLQVPVDESQIASIRKGMKLPVTIAGVPGGMEGTVAEIVPAADPGSHSFMVKIDLPTSPQLHAGVYGSVEISTGERQAIFVPRSAVVERGSLHCAYVLDGKGMAQLRYVTLGGQQGNLVEVLSGISGGEKLVDEPGDRDLAGKRIEVQR